MKKYYPKKIKKTKNPLARHHHYEKPPSLRSTVKAQDSRGLQHGGERRSRLPTAGCRWQSWTPSGRRRHRHWVSAHHLTNYQHRQPGCCSEPLLGDRPWLCGGAQPREAFAHDPSLGRQEGTSGECCGTRQSVLSPSAHRRDCLRFQPSLELVGKPVLQLHRARAKLTVCWDGNWEDARCMRRPKH